jgi:hypothetical protein
MRPLGSLRQRVVDVVPQLLFPHLTFCIAFCASIFFCSASSESCRGLRGGRGLPCVRKYRP